MVTLDSVIADALNRKPALSSATGNMCFSDKAEKITVEKQMCSLSPTLYSRDCAANLDI